MTPTTTTPISSALETEVLGELRRRGIVFWLDRDDHYSSYVDSAAIRHEGGDFPYPVVGFRGSFLELMLALEDHESGLDQTPLLVHMPGFTEDSIRETPLLELYKAGFRYRRALGTLIRETAAGRLPPNEIEAFLSGEDFSLTTADEWLHHNTAGKRTGVAGLLDGASLEVIIRELLIKDTFLSEHLDQEQAEDLDELRAYLARQLGLSEAWLSFIGHADSQTPPLTAVVDALSSWILCVEYVDDLTRPPYLKELQPLTGLPKKIINLCRAQAGILRSQHPDNYEIIADQVESHLEVELHQIRPEDLGRIDTFRTEEARILEAAIDALNFGEWSKAKQWAEARSETMSFWLRRDQRRRVAWDLVADGARLGYLLEDHKMPFDGVASFEDALHRYTGAAFRVDRAHRRFEQLCASRLQHQLPHFTKLKEVLSRLRRQYRNWADSLATDFSTLCRVRGLLPDASLLQRSFFSSDVLPLTQSGERVAIFLIDALRYEMATELAEEFEEPGTKVKLTARYAELPTITSVGMNALAPVSRGGRLKLAGATGFRGFSTGEFVVDDPKDRAKTMGLRCTGEQALSLSLNEVCEIEPATLSKRVAQKQVIVVHGREIDEAGEAGVGLAAFEQTLAQVKAAWLHLKALGVSRFVFSADHGFLLQDSTTKVRPYGKKTDTNRRYVLSSEQRVEDGLITTSLTELGYDGRDGFLLFAEDTSVFDGKGAAQTFMHGGNSPQERIVPVLSVISAHASNQDLSAYLVEAESQEDALGYHRVRVRLILDREKSAALPFPRSEPVDLAIRAAGQPEIHATVVGASGSATEKRGRIQTHVGEQWSEVFFTLKGPEESRVRIEVFHPDSIEQVKTCEVEGWFQVHASNDATPAAPGKTAAETDTGEQWSASLPDEAIRRIFVHINLHGVITEAEAVGILGSPRKFRRFSTRFEELCALTPLRVRIEVTPTGKRYVREGRSV